jgi:hypothetical protein
MKHILTGCVVIGAVMAFSTIRSEAVNAGKNSISARAHEQDTIPKKKDTPPHPMPDTSKRPKPDTPPGQRNH